MKAILNLFSWVASGLVNGLCPGGMLADSIAEELKRYKQSAKIISENMQRAWHEAIKTLELVLGGKTLLVPQSRKQFAEKFAKEVITPFAVQRNLTGTKLDSYLNATLKQCQQLMEIQDEILNFESFDEQALLEALSQTNEETAEDMGILIIDRIQTRMPNARELLELLWERNLLLEGLIAHFNFILANSPSLADLVEHLNQQRVQKELAEIRQKLEAALKQNQLTEIAKLGSQLTHLAKIDELYNLQKKYQDLFGSLFERLDQLRDDHVEIKSKLDQALEILAKLEKMQRTRTTAQTIHPEMVLQKPSHDELQLANELSTMVKSIGWESFPENQRTIAVNSLVISLYSSEKICQSLNIMEDVLRHCPTSPELYFNYFQALQAVQRYPEAVQAYIMAIQQKPELALFPPEQYQMQGIIGKGGMGVVYKALWLEKNIPVAIKVLLLPEETYPGARNRFIQAGQTAKILAHPNVVKIYDFLNISAKYPCVIMEYLDGCDMQQHVQKHGPYQLEQGLAIGYAIGQGLAYAHESGIIHRDLKPGNVVLTSRGPVIIDFGLAKWQKDSTLTLSGEAFYTLYYSSPEQRADFHGVDQRSDIYSFGKTLCYMFTGEEPYDIVWESIPEIIQPILRKATNKKPEDRYKSMQEMLSCLQLAMNGESQTSIEVCHDAESFPLVYAQPAVQPAPIPENLLEKISGNFMVEAGHIISEKDGAPMVAIPGGSFLMGDDSDRADYDESPIHEVELDAYLMDVYPVTNRQYRLFLEELSKIGQHPTPWCHPDEPTEKIHVPQFWYSKEWNQDNHPVVGVDWWDAYAYATWAGKCLPTEAEWELAARGNDGRIYPWGNELPTLAICNFDNAYKSTTPVDKFPQDLSPYGCSNMAGNVWQWCWDWFDPTYYKHSPKKNPQGSETGRCRVGRGGCWMNDVKRIRTTTRGTGDGPGDRKNRLGFRCAIRLH